MEKTVVITFHAPKELWKQIKIFVAENGMTMQGFMTIATKKLLQTSRKESE